MSMIVVMIVVMTMITVPIMMNKAGRDEDEVLLKRLMMTMINLDNTEGPQ